MIGARVLRSLRHPVRAASYLRPLVGARYRLPFGDTAQLRRLLRRVDMGDDNVLVIGPVTPVRQAMRKARLDVVGTSPYDDAVTVVSAADGDGSLPPRWQHVIVTDVAASTQCLQAALGACLPEGEVLVVAPSNVELPDLPGARIDAASAASGQLVLTRVRHG